MRTTLVTGASGFLGAHVVAAALARSRGEATLADPLGPPVVAQSRGPALLAPRFGEGPRDAAEWVERDLAGQGALGLLDAVRPDEVIHCAAMSRAATCEAEPEMAAELNGRVPGAIATWCAARGARLIHVSTDLVFGETDAPPRGFEEAAEPAPLSTYGRTKLEGERAVLEAFPEATVARLPLLYGNSGGRGLGASDSLLEAIERGEKPRLFVDEWRTPLEVSNAAEALVELLDFDHGGVLHLAGPDRVTRHEFGLAVLAAMGLEPGAARGEIEEARQADLDAGAPRPRDVSLDARLAARHLETGLHGVEVGMARAVAP